MEIERVSAAIAPLYAYSEMQIISNVYPVINIDIGSSLTNISIFKEYRPKYYTSFCFASNAIFGNGYAKDILRENGLVRLFEKKFINWVEANRGSLYNLVDTYFGEGIGIHGLGSAEINAFLFSVENNYEVKQSKIRSWSYADLLSDRADIKVVFLIFYSAIIYHLARMMKSLELSMPRQVVISGGGAKIIQILDASPQYRNTIGLTKLIFEHIYDQKYHDDGLDILVGSSPKENTCYGAINMAHYKLTNTDCPNAILVNKNIILVDNINSRTNKSLRYKDFEDDSELLDDIEKEVREFIDFFFTIDDLFSFYNKFGALTKSQIAPLKSILSRDLKNNLKAGLKLHLEGRDIEENVSEPLFFNPLVGALFQLLRYFADKTTE